VAAPFASYSFFITTAKTSHLDKRQGVLLSKHMHTIVSLWYLCMHMYTSMYSLPLPGSSSPPPRLHTSTNGTWSLLYIYTYNGKYVVSMYSSKSVVSILHTYPLPWSGSSSPPPRRPTSTNGRVFSFVNICSSKYVVSMYSNKHVVSMYAYLPRSPTRFFITTAKTSHLDKQQNIPLYIYMQ